jgi:NAD(P)-dependent dehydrogenase (short-subunit alcohol dehydrogenase family)
MKLTNKRAVVTGAASGIGRATALKFHAEGAAGIVVADMNEAGLQPVAQAVTVSGPLDNLLKSLTADIAQDNLAIDALRTQVMIK